MSTPASDTLTRAADRLEELAKHFDDYVRYVETCDDRAGGFGTSVEAWHYDNTESLGRRDALKWIETMSPAVARPLVMWLRDNANRALEYQHSGHALDFAELILGETE